MKNFFIIIISYILINANSLIYEVKSISYLKKSLRKLSSDNSFLHYIEGDSYYLNYYYTSLYLGQNKSRQVYILDTGSSITTSPCSLCSSCGTHLNPKYYLESTSQILNCNDNKCKISSASRCSNNKCSFNIRYAEGSKLSGVYVQQKIYFEKINEEKNITNESFNIPIGCTTEETHLFKTQLADGIMGLNNNENSFVSMLYKLNIIKKNIFSLCLEHEGGYFSIGEIYDKYHYSKNIQYVNLVNKNFGNYIIKLNYIKIGEDKVDINIQAIIDSGTTMTYFPPSIFQAIMKLILDKCKKSKKCGKLQKIQNFGYCSPIKTEEDITKLVENGWGNLTFFFDEDVKFIWMPKNYHYIYKLKENEIYLCLGFDEDKRSTILLGTTFMHGFDFIFDKEQHKIGMVEANCTRNKENNNLNNINNETDINNEINIDNFDADEINNNINNINNITNNISQIDINNKNNNNKNKFNINDDEYNFDKSIIKICYYIICITCILFVIFNIILCKDNYNVIQQRKDDEDIDKVVMENYRHDINNGPISLFNDNI